MLSSRILKCCNEKREEDIEALLRSNHFNLYYFDLCCSISLVKTAEILKKNPDLVEKVSKAFENVNTYHLQERLKKAFDEETASDARKLDPCFPDIEKIERWWKDDSRDMFYRLMHLINIDDLTDQLMQKLKDRGVSRETMNTYQYENIAFHAGLKLLYGDQKPEDYYKQRADAAKELNEMFGFEKKLAQTEDKMQDLTGREMMAIMKTPEEDLPAYQEKRNLDKLLDSYYDDTAWLSQRGDTDLCYTMYNNDSRWVNGLNCLLDLVGAYQDDPKFEEQMEDRIGALFAHATFDEPKTHFSYMSRKGVDAFRDNMIKEVKKDPHSAKSKFYLKHAKNVLTQHRSFGEPPYKETMTKLTEFYIKTDPKTAAMILEYGKDACSAEYVARLYDESKSEDFLLILTSKIKDMQEEGGTLPLEGKLLAYTYAAITGDKDLQKLSQAKIGKHISITDACLTCLHNEVDYQAFLKELRASKVSEISLSIKSKLKEGELAMLNELVQQHPSLKLIGSKRDYTSSAIASPAIDGAALATNPKLEEIKGLNVVHSEKLLNEASVMQKIGLANKKGDVEIDAFYQALMDYKPAFLEHVNAAFSETQKVALMNKHPDMLVNYEEYSLNGLQCRNEAVIQAKKTRKTEDVKEVIRHEGIAEYLSVIDEKDRPSFEDFNKEGYFELMRDNYEDKYFKVLTQVSDLCGFTELKKEAELLKAVQDKKVVEYLKSLDEKDRPTFLELLNNKTVATETPTTIVKEIKNSYKQKAEEVLGDLLDLLDPSAKELQILSENKSLSGVLQKHIVRKKNKVINDASVAAFEKWKQERGK